MKTILIFLFAALPYFVFGQTSPTPKTLDSEMARLNTQTALIVYSQAIDEYPLWSPKADFIGCNIAGKWYKFRLTDIELSEAKWRKQQIGMLATKDAHSELKAEELKEYKAVSKFNAREVTTKSGTKVELKETGSLSVSLVVTRPGQEPQTLWTSGGENCHSLVLSPDEKYVAYLCEMNGLLIMKLAH